MPVKKGHIATNPKSVVIPCERTSLFKQAVNDYADALIKAGPTLGSHNMPLDVFNDSGLFKAAIERIRGQQAARTKIKRGFIDAVLDHMKSARAIYDWEFTGTGERHDYRVTLNSRKVSIIEAKGCLDGNNTNIYKRPADAEEFLIWSLCQNAGSDPRKNAWSGIHTRLGANIIDQNERVDGLIIWDMLCGTVARPCPKTIDNATRLTRVSVTYVVPPPCLYLFPSTIPDPRNNPSPRCWSLREIGFIDALSNTFKCSSDEIYQIKIEARMNAKSPDLERQTILIKGGTELARSKWTKLKRASR
jgi:hypothetical protein